MRLLPLAWPGPACWAVLAALVLMAGTPVHAEPLTLQLRSQRPADASGLRFHTVTQSQQWNAPETAVIV